MWVIGLALLFAVTAVPAYVAARRPGKNPDIWDIPGTARTYTTIVGTLAGFSVTSSIFIANLSVVRQSTSFESVIALFLGAFLVFISSAMEFGTTPNLARTDPVYGSVQAASYLLASANYYLGLTLSWLGLPLLLEGIGLQYVSDVFIWLVLLAIVGGGMRLAGSGLSALVGANYGMAVVLPLTSFAAAALYRRGLAEPFPALLPSEHETVLFAVVGYVVAAAGFFIQSGLVSLLRAPGRLERAGTPMSVGLSCYSSAVFTTASLLWLAVQAEL